MKNFGQFRYFLLFAITISGTAAAETFSQKTFFAPREVGTNRAMEYTTWQEMAYKQVKAPSTSKINSHVSLTTFYQESQKSDDMGKYFGIGNGKNSFLVGTVAAGEVINNYLIHDSAGANVSELAGTITFKPKQEIYGMRLDYFQDINSPIKKFFFKASMPVVHVQNDMGMKITGGHAVGGDGLNKDYTLQDFFAGRVDKTGGNRDSQSALTKGKIDGRRSATGIADLNLALGYKLHYSPKSHLFINSGLLIPTGTKPHGEYLFEPRCGNGGHTGFTAGIDGGVTLWTSSEKKASVRMLAALDYRYLFESSETRMLQLNNSFLNGKFNSYYLGQTIGQDYGIPAANIFTRGLTVKPGSQGEALVDLSFKCSGFVIDLGYNAFYKEKESVWLKNWNSPNFIIATRINNMGNASNHVTTSAAISSSDFNIDAVTNPAQFTHKAFGGFGYSFALAKTYIAHVGLGASYEFATDNAAMEAVAFWAKAGISF